MLCQNWLWCSSSKSFWTFCDWPLACNVSLGDHLSGLYPTTPPANQGSRHSFRIRYLTGGNRSASQGRSLSKFSEILLDCYWRYGPLKQIFAFFKLQISSRLKLLDKFPCNCCDCNFIIFTKTSINELKWKETVWICFLGGILRYCRFVKSTPITCYQYDRS